MAIFGKKDESKGFSEGSRFRTFGSFALVLVLVLGGMFYLYYKRATEGVKAAAGVRGTPGLSTTASSDTASPEFVKLVREQNIKQAEQAQKSGGSAIASVVRPGYYDTSEFDTQAAKKGCSVAELKRAREAGVSAFELRCRGCSSAALKAAGYTAGELRAAGFSPEELKAAGFGAKELRDAGFSAAELKNAGYDVTDLADAGYTAAELAQAGFTADQIKFAGKSAAEMAAAGIGIGTPSNMPRDCQIESLKKARADGISAAQLRKLGCGAAALRAAGYTAKELKEAGFTAAELRAAGFSAKELKDAGFTAAELLKAGFSVKDLKNAGFTAAQLRAAGVSAEDLLAAGFTPDELRAAGFSEGELLRAGVAPPTVAKGGVSGPCDAENITKLRAAGVQAKALLAVGCTPDQLKTAGYTDDDILGKTDAAQSAQGQGATGQGRTTVTTLGDGARSAANDSSIAAIGQTEEEEFLSKLQRQQERQLNANQRADEINKISTAMRNNATSLFAIWTPPATQKFEQAEEQKDKQSAEGGDKANGEGGASGQSKADQLRGATSQVPSLPITAGTIIFGVLDTGVNSDEDSPVLATVVGGKFKGAKLVGKFKVLEKKLLIDFDKMSLPWYESSVPVRVVAIDPDTARTALANHVDNHYFLRYGTLFASSFMSGLAQAISSSGSTTSATTAGVTTTTPKLNTGEKLMVALGEVGTQYANVLGSNFNRRPTVTVEGGQAVGLLFLDDTRIPLPAAAHTVMNGE